MFKSLISALMICGAMFFVCSKIYESIKKRTSKNHHSINSHLSRSSAIKDNNCSRKSMRLKRPLAVLLTCKSNPNGIKTYTEDVSIAGAFIRYEEKIKIGDRMKIEFIDEKRLPIMAAQVIWSNHGVPRDILQNPGFGIKFTDVSKDMRSVLEHIISELK